VIKNRGVLRREEECGVVLDCRVAHHCMGACTPGEDIHLTASEREGNNSIDICLKMVQAKAKIWPGRSLSVPNSIDSGGTGKKESKMPSGNAVSFSTVASRTTAWVPALQVPSLLFITLQPRVE